MKRRQSKPRRFAWIAVILGMVFSPGAHIQAAGVHTSKVECQFGLIYMQYTRGRMVGTHSPILGAQDTPTYDLVLEQTSLAGWSYEEKRELAFLLAITTQLDAASLDTFKYMLGKDAHRVGLDFQKLKADILKDRIGLSSAEVVLFRRVSDFLISRD